MAGNQHVLQNEHALAQWLATSTAWRRNMRSVDGWQIRASPPRAPYRPMSAHDLPMICPWSPLYLQVGTVKMRKKFVLVIFFRFSQNSEKSQFFLKKIDFFKYFLIFFFKNFKFGITQHPLSYVHRGQKKVAISEKWEYTQKRKTCRNLWRGTCAAIVYMKSTLKCRFLEGKSIILKMNVETSFDLYILTTAAYDKIV